MFSFVRNFWLVFFVRPYIRNLRRIREEEALATAQIEVLDQVLELLDLIDTWCNHATSQSDPAYYVCGHCHAMKPIAKDEIMKHSSDCVSNILISLNNNIKMKKFDIIFR